MSVMICILMSLEVRRKGRRGLHTFGIRNLYINLWLVFRWWEQRDTGRPLTLRLDRLVLQRERPLAAKENNSLWGGLEAFKENFFSEGTQGRSKGRGRGACPPPQLSPQLLWLLLLHRRSCQRKRLVYQSIRLSVSCSHFQIIWNQPDIYNVFFKVS